MNDDAGRGSYHHGHLREALLERAQVVLRESGVDGLSLRQLARDLDVSSGAPRRHFRDKSALLDAVALAGLARLDAAMASAGRTGHCASDVRAVTRTYLRFAVDDPALVDLVFARKQDRPEILGATHRIVDYAVSIIRWGQEKGQIAPGDATRLGVAVFTPALGLADLARAGIYSFEEAAGLLDDAIDLMMRGLRPGGGSAASAQE